MKRLARRLVLPAFFVVQQAHAGALVHIPDGDCDAFKAALSAPAGQEPGTILLARNGHYDCALAIDGNVSIDGQGASLSLELPSIGGNFVDVGPGATVTLRNLTLAGPAGAKAKVPAPSVKPSFPFTFGNQISNDGNLTLDTVTVANAAVSISGSSVIPPAAFLINSGQLTLRNVSFVGNTVTGTTALIANGGTVDISQSTFDNAFPNALLAWNNGTFTFSNSIIVDNGGVTCSSNDPPLAPATHFISRGGNIGSDSTCGLSGPNDKLVDPRFADFGTHGGVVQTLAVDYFSPAIGNGIAANCEAADARGRARNSAACDSGAYEFGGGEGQLDQTGMSGLYFNSANDGHYVSVQRLGGNTALVIWNTFDQHGTPAWLYGVGTVNGDAIHVSQVAQNVGGALLPGGDVAGSKATFWGTLDVSFPDCAHASLSYNSALPQFGTGSTPLERLALLSGVECKH